MKTRTYNLEELQAMTPEERSTVFMTMVKMSGTAIVRDKDGNIKYDDPAQKGTYLEDMADGTNT